METGRPKKFKKVEDLENAINEYFEECDKDKRLYTVCGLCMHLDIDRKTLLNYEKNPENKKFFHTIKRAKLKIEEQLERCLYSAGSPTGVIFNLKYNFGWKDKHEFDVQQDKPFNVKIEVVK